MGNLICNRCKQPTNQLHTHLGTGYCVTCFSRAIDNSLKEIERTYAREEEDENSTGN